MEYSCGARFMDTLVMQTDQFLLVDDATASRERSNLKIVGSHGNRLRLNAVKPTG